MIFSKALPPAQRGQTYNYPKGNNMIERTFTEAFSKEWNTTS